MRYNEYIMSLSMSIPESYWIMLDHFGYQCLNVYLPWSLLQGDQDFASFALCCQAQRPSDSARCDLCGLAEARRVQIIGSSLYVRAKCWKHVRATINLRESVIIMLYIISIIHVIMYVMYHTCFIMYLLLCRASSYVGRSVE